MESTFYAFFVGTFQPEGPIHFMEISRVLGLGLEALTLRVGFDALKGAPLELALRSGRNWAKGARILWPFEDVFTRKMMGK